MVSRIKHQQCQRDGKECLAVIFDAKDFVVDDCGRWVTVFIGLEEANELLNNDCSDCCCPNCSPLRHLVRTALTVNNEKLVDQGISP